MAPRILVTGFEPFGRWAVNSSWEGALALAALRPGLTIRRLPVDHARAAAEVARLIDDLAPDALLLTGLADDAECRIERRARRPAALADADGPAELAAAWPLDRAARAVAAAAPCRLSDDAGGYVCETGYWAALARRHATGRPARVLFLHVPPLSPDWPAARIAAAMAAALDSA